MSTNAAAKPVATKKLAYEMGGEGSLDMGGADGYLSPLRPWIVNRLPIRLITMVRVSLSSRSIGCQLTPKNRTDVQTRFRAGGYLCVISACFSSLWFSFWWHWIPDANGSGRRVAADLAGRIANDQRGGSAGAPRVILLPAVDRDDNGRTETNTTTCE